MHEMDKQVLFFKQKKNDLFARRQNEKKTSKTKKKEKFIYANWTSIKRTYDLRAHTYAYIFSLINPFEWHLKWKTKKTKVGMPKRHFELVNRNHADD